MGAGGKAGENHDEENLASMLQKGFKLTRYEAKLYIALLKGASNPREASSMSGVPLPRIYDVVRVLESKGFVVASEGWYRPLPPRAVAVAEIARVESEARSRVRQIIEVAEALERIASSAREDVEVALLDGLYSILSAAAEDLGKTSRLIVVASSALKGSEDALVPLLRDSASRGVKTLVALTGESKARVAESLSGDVQVVELKTWLPDMIATDIKVIYIVPDRKARSVKGISVKDPAYASEVASRLREALKP